MNGFLKINQLKILIKNNYEMAMNYGEKVLELLKWKKTL